MKKKTVFLSVILVATLAALFLLFKTPESKQSEEYCFDLDSIRIRGKIIAVTDFNSADYFIYKGEPMGFTYEMLNQFAGFMDLDVEIITESDPEKMVDMLVGGKVDIIAAGMPVLDGDENIIFTEPFDKTRKVLVKRKRQVVKNTKTQEDLRDQLGLGKNAIYIQSGYLDYNSALNVASSLGDTITILDAPYDQETLIKYVAEGVIDYTICDENLAMVNSTYYPSIDINTQAGPEHQIAWAVRNNSDSLLFHLNTWITSYKKTTGYALLYAKYFRNSRSGIIIQSDYYAINTGKISGYDELIRKYSSGTLWDWRLIASIICQESRFNPSVQSHMGAYGLMQIMPETAETMGIDITSSPDSNIIAGLKYLDFLNSIYDNKVPDEKERIKFILASYNAGPGHVLDAMKLAAKHGVDPALWENNVELWLLRKSERQHYTDSVVSFGYFKGVESVNFVTEVIDRYNHYKNVVPEITDELYQKH
ncbi:MAG TPA: transglycosylase SLT domain-containing protein [Bacteroidales bacterium]|nr:transglycosylase SLT domain-containing protein [Bacteroidales bacterium]